MVANTTPPPKKALAHSFVMANAGSGKTTALVGRLLRILLRGVMPHQIMCLTYTKAAAAEMAERLHSKLAFWSLCDDEDFIKDYINLEKHEPSQADIDYARTLFHLVLDSPGGLRLQTIHAFCESLLKRFPLEANLPPDFKILDDGRANQLLKQAYRHAIRQFQNLSHHDLNLSIIGKSLLQEDMINLTKQIYSQKTGNAPCDIGDVNGQAMQSLNSHLKPCYADSWQAICRNRDDIEDIYKSHLQNGTQKQADTAQTLLDLLAIIDHINAPSDEQKETSINQFISYFLTKEGEPRTLFDKSKFEKNHPEYAANLKELTILAIQILDDQRQVKTKELTKAVWIFAHEIEKRYIALKQAQAWLDFDDLIAHSDRLLNDHSAAWVHYKLDQGIRHILVDEAQDTNPLQWRILNQLSDPFFEEPQLIDKERTIFAVGDIKQSIFSFQGSQPDEFLKAQFAIEEKSLHAGHSFKPKNLVKSYRSSPIILEFVDEVFKDERLAFGLDKNQDNGIEHIAHHENLAGKITIWPPYLGDVKPKSQGFLAWVNEDETTHLADLNPKEVLANEIARWVKEKINNSLIEEVRDNHIIKRPVKAGDINILLRKRNPYQALLTKALMDAGIPVMGEDRLQLNTELAIKDMINFLHWLIAPHDDLRLAILLKSPICNLSEEALFELSYQRKGTLLNSLKTSQDEHHKDIYDFLSQILQDVDFTAPHEFLRYILNKKAPYKKEASQTSHDGGIFTIGQAFIYRLGPITQDSLEEFLSASLLYENYEAPTLRGFLDWFDEFASDVKREYSEQTNEVRIMTIHAAKGLEAPIIILPDTTNQRTRHQKQVLWYEDDEIPLPIIPPNSQDIPSQFWPLSDEEKENADKESQRLFYVALTRAKNELLICGADKKTKEINTPEQWLIKHKDTWLSKASNSIKAIGKTTKQTSFVNHTDDELMDLILNYAGEDVLEGEDYEEKILVETKETALAKAPDWLFQKAHYEAPPRQPLRPSQANTPDDNDYDNTDNQQDHNPVHNPKWDHGIYYHSPLYKEGEKQDTALQPRLRGILIHLLLEKLPDIEPDYRKAVAHKVLKTKAKSDAYMGLNDDMIDKIIDDVFNILDNDDYKPFFGANSYSEIMVKGMIQTSQDRDIALGQIDRLVIDKEHVFILDYKSNQAVPKRMEDVPSDYVRQMRIYRDLLRPLYPNKTVKTALLWTEMPILMYLNDDLLNRIDIL